MAVDYDDLMISVTRPIGPYIPEKNNPLIKIFCKLGGEIMKLQKILFYLLGLLYLFFSPSISFSATLFRRTLRIQTLPQGVGMIVLAGRSLQQNISLAVPVHLNADFLQGAAGCSGGTPARHLFTGTDEVYVSYWVKYSANWTGSNRSYHPHEFMILTNLEGDYAGPAYTHLTAYIEQNEGIPLLALQDGHEY